MTKQNPFDLSGQVAVVTGGNGGLGLQCASERRVVRAARLPFAASGGRVRTGPRRGLLRLAGAAGGTRRGSRLDRLQGLGLTLGERLWRRTSADDRRCGLAGRLPASKGRAGRRLGVVEYMALDPKTRLVLVRRDDTQHLLLLGAAGPVVVERGIEALPEPETIKAEAAE